MSLAFYVTAVSVSLCCKLVAIWLGLNPIFAAVKWFAEKIVPEMTYSRLSRKLIGAVDKTSSSFSVHGKIGNFIII